MSFVMNLEQEWIVKSLLFYVFEILLSKSSIQNLNVINTYKRYCCKWFRKDGVKEEHQIWV